MALPERFNMSRYCLGPAPHRPPEKVGLVVVHDPHDPARGVERWTFGELDHAVRAVAAGLLDLGLRPGQRLVLRLAGRSEYPLLFFGAIAAGIVAVPTSSQLTAREFAFVVDDSGASAVATDDEPPAGQLVVTPAHVARWRGESGLDAYADTRAEDPAFLVYTSGTTGAPKGVLHAQRSAWGRRPMYDGWYGIEPADVMLHAGALNWTYTLGVGLTDPWAVGASAVVYDGPKDPAIWPTLIAATGATLFAAVPGVYRQLLDSGADLAHLATLRHGLTAGEALPPALRLAWTAATGTELHEALGMSEISTFVSSSPTVPARPGSPGRPQAGRRVAVLPAEDGPGGDVPLPRGEIGRLAVHRSDPGLMLGYWNRPDEDAEARRGDWFVSGDLVHEDEDGYLVHHGRSDDVMTSMGYRVSPLEVEAVLSHVPGVAEVAVTEVPVREGVRVITAYVVRAEGPAGAGLTEADLLTEARAGLAAYKCPRRMVVVDALPRTTNGKVRRAALRELDPMASRRLGHGADM